VLRISESPSGSYRQDHQSPRNRSVRRRIRPWRRYIQICIQSMDETRKWGVGMQVRPRTFRRQARTFVLLCMLLTGFGAVGVIPPPVAAAASAPVIAPAQAAQVVRSWVAADNAALQTFNVAAVNTLEGPPLSDADDPSVRAKVPSSPFGLSNVTVYVPNQSAYPAQFLTSVVLSSGQTSGTDFLVFTKHSKSAPWKAVYDTPYNPPTNNLVLNSLAARPILVDQQGYARLVTASSALKVNPSTLAHLAASYVQQSLGAKRPAPSKVFDPSLAQFVLAGAGVDAANGATDTSVVEPGAYSVYSYRTTDGGALTFVTLRGRIHSVSKGSTPIAKPTVLGQPVGGNVPGLTKGQPYRSIDVNVLATLAFAVTPSKSQTPLGVVGFAITPVSGTGVPG
jgi:hypothetical protein